MTSELLEAALALAGQGCPVFPLRPGSKIPFPGTAGFKDATTELDVVERWWTDQPEANIGVPTGVLFDVIDLDGIDGINNFADWADAHAGGVDNLPNPTVLTPSGGCHIYVKPSGMGNRAGMLPKVDYRGVSGYVVVPPSRLPHGEYRWT